MSQQSIGGRKTHNLGETLQGHLSWQGQSKDSLPILGTANEAPLKMFQGLYIEALSQELGPCRAPGHSTTKGTKVILYTLGVLGGLGQGKAGDKGVGHPAMGAANPVYGDLVVAMILLIFCMMPQFTPILASRADEGVQLGIERACRFPP